jgi:hypothetical protein
VNHADSYNNSPQVEPESLTYVIFGSNPYARRQ